MIRFSMPNLILRQKTKHLTYFHTHSFINNIWTYKKQQWLYVVFMNILWLYIMIYKHIQIALYLYTEYYYHDIQMIIMIYMYI